MDLRYMGFDQRANCRVFRFDIMPKGEATRQAVVTADIALFLQHRIALQEGPTLCAGKLNADLDGQIAGEHVLTADDMRAYTEGRAAAEAKRAEARRNSGRRYGPGPAAFVNPRAHE